MYQGQRDPLLTTATTWGPGMEVEARVSRRRLPSATKGRSLGHRSMPTDPWADLPALRPKPKWNAACPSASLGACTVGRGAEIQLTKTKHTHDTLFAVIQPN